MSSLKCFLETIQYRIEISSSVKQCKKNCKPPLLNDKAKNAISTNRQVLKRFREVPTASNETRIIETLSEK